MSESDDDLQDGRYNNDHEHYDGQQGQRHRRGGLKGSSAAAAAAAADAHSADRLNSRLQLENRVNQPASSSRSVRSPKFVIPRPSIIALTGIPTPVTPSLRQQLRQHSAPRPASAPARGRGGRKDVGDDNSDVVRSRALPSRLATATAAATAAARHAAENVEVKSDQPRKQSSSSLNHVANTSLHYGVMTPKDLPSMLYKDAEFRTLRRQLLGVQQELILEQSATP